jgi:hypothetical protein
LLLVSLALTPHDAPPSFINAGVFRLEPDGFCSPLPLLGEGLGVRVLERSRTRSALEQFAWGTVFLMKLESMTAVFAHLEHKPKL